MYALVQFKRGSPTGFDYIRPINQFYPCTGQHSVHNTSDCFDDRSTQIFTVVYRIAGNITLHTSPKGGISGEIGVRRLVSHLIFITKVVSALK
jgi:hypothetical protein